MEPRRRRLVCGVLAGIAMVLARAMVCPGWAAAGEAAAWLLVGGGAGWWVNRGQRMTPAAPAGGGEELASVHERVAIETAGFARTERLSALGQLSAGLAHEIRNPLASISGAAAILERNRNLDAKQARCVEIIARESRRLNELLTNFLNFARPRRPRLEPVAIEGVLDEVLLLVSHGVRGQSVRLEKRVEAGLPAAECDAEQLEQVLLNLMMNAIDASPDGGVVTLSAGREAAGVAIRVTDRGHGVDESHIDRLFDPFFTTKQEGTGLGLPVAHQIMRQMGGALVAERNAGEGMTFRVMVPVKEAGV